MTYEKQIKEVLGDDFDVRWNDTTNDFEIRLRLTSIVFIDASLLANNPTHEIIKFERDKLLINMKRELTKLLWKYLGDIGKNY